MEDKITKIYSGLVVISQSLLLVLLAVGLIEWRWWILAPLISVPITAIIVSLVKAYHKF